jgi:hypothetical protein
MRASPAQIEKTLILPTWHFEHNQGEQGCCVGHGTSIAMAMRNEHQLREAGEANPRIRYNPWWLWDRAKEVDEWPDTNPGDDNGTSVKAACAVLANQGHVIWTYENDIASFSKPDRNAGIKSVSWAQNVDEIRTAIYFNFPCSIGVNWYEKFDDPIYRDGRWWIGTEVDWGKQTGGHCTALFGASDFLQACPMKNSWGPDYPEVYLPYKAIERLIREDGEVAVMTDL